MNNHRTVYSQRTSLALLIFWAIGSHQESAFGQLAIAKGLERDLAAFVEIFEAGRLEAERFLKERRVREEPCTSFYEPISAGSYLLAADSQAALLTLRQNTAAMLDAIRPLTDLEQQLQKRRHVLEMLEADRERSNTLLRGLRADVSDVESHLGKLVELRTEQQERLRTIEQGQLAAISRWLVQNFGDRVNAVDLGESQTVIRTTLFGTFLIRHPPVLSADTPAEITAVFTPSVFGGDFFAGDIGVGVSGYSSSVVEYISLTSSFDEGQFRTVGNNPLEWAWTIRSPNNFNGIRFAIKMQIRRQADEEPSNFNVLDVALPVEITSLPVESWLKRFGIVLFSGFFSGAVMTKLDEKLVSVIRLRKEKRKSRIIVPGVDQ